MVVAVIAARYDLLHPLDSLLVLDFSILLDMLVSIGSVWLLRRDYVDEISTMVFGER